MSSWPLGLQDKAMPGISTAAAYLGATTAFWCGDTLALRLSITHHNPNATHLSRVGAEHRLYPLRLSPAGAQGFHVWLLTKEVAKGSLCRTPSSGGKGGPLRVLHPAPTPAVRARHPLEEGWWVGAMETGRRNPRALRTARGLACCVSSPDLA